MHPVRLSMKDRDRLGADVTSELAVRSRWFLGKFPAQGTEIECQAHESPSMRAHRARVTSSGDAPPFARTQIQSCEEKKLVLSSQKSELTEVPSQFRLRCLSMAYLREAPLSVRRGAAEDCAHSCVPVSCLIQQLY